MRGLVRDVLKTDEIIHSQQLGVEWTTPSIPESVHHVHPPEQILSATQVAQEVFSNTSASSSQQSLLSDSERRRDATEDAGHQGEGHLGGYPTSLVRQAMEMISEEGEFLVEVRHTTHTNLL